MAKSYEYTCSTCKKTRTLSRGGYDYAKKYGKNCKKCSKSNEKHPFFEKHHSEETKRKLSKIRKIYNDETQYSAKKQRRHFHYWFNGATNGFEKYVGIPLDAFKYVIQAKFQIGMNWNNYGTEWQIDHDWPLSSFDLTKEEHVKTAWNWRNLNPMFSKINNQKGSKLKLAQEFFQY